MQSVFSWRERWRGGSTAFAVTILGYLGLERWAESLGVAPMEGLRSLLGLSAVMAFVLAAALGYRIGDWRRRPWSSVPGEAGRGQRRRQYALWFVELRWIAVAATGASILLSVRILELLPSGMLWRLFGWWAVLVASNLVFRRWALRGGEHERQVLVQAVLDLIVLTGLLNASGGLENPFFIFYLFPVILAGILLPKRMALGVTAAALGLFLFLSVGEWAGFLPHVTNSAFPHALAEGQGSHEEHAHGDEEEISEREEPHFEELPETQHASLEGAFVFARIAPFAAVLVLMALLTTMVMERLRRADAELALKAQEANHAAKLAALGRMAAGIAHEVGNP